MTPAMLVPNTMEEKYSDDYESFPFTEPVRVKIYHMYQTTNHRPKTKA